MQEALVSGYRSFRQFRGDNLAAWLMRIVANRCRDMLRSQRSRPTSPLDPLAPSAQNFNDPELAKRAVTGNQGLLHGIFRQGPIVEDPAGQVIGLGLVGLDDAIEATGLAGPVLDQQRIMGGGRLGMYHLVRHLPLERNPAVQQGPGHHKLVDL